MTEHRVIDASYTTSLIPLIAHLKLCPIMDDNELSDGTVFEGMSNGTPLHAVITQSGRVSVRFPTYDAQIMERQDVVPVSPTQAMKRTPEAQSNLEIERSPGFVWRTLKDCGMKWHYLQLEKNYAAVRMTPPGTNFVPCLPGYSAIKYMIEENIGVTWWLTIREANHVWEQNGCPYITKKKIPEAKEAPPKRAKKSNVSGASDTDATALGKRRESATAATRDSSVAEKRQNVEVTPHGLSLDDFHDYSALEIREHSRGQSLKDVRS